MIYFKLTTYRQGVTALRIAICDDDALCREQAVQLVKEYIDNSVRAIELTVYEKTSTMSIR